MSARQLWAQYDAWAIDTRSQEAHGFIGVLWFGDEPPAYLQGCRTALFRTRRDARTALQKVKPEDGYRAFPRATVVRVHVAVELTGGAAPARAIA
jgi:hypothetical protein